MVTISSSLLSYNSKTKTFTGFLSDYIKANGTLPASIIIKSHKTGAEKLFEFGDADSIDGDLVAYFYTCKSDDFYLTLYND